MRVWLTFLILVSLLPTFARAQTEENEGTRRFNIHTGRMLPFRIDGVTEIYPYWGARYGYSMWGQNFEWNSKLAVGRGIKLYNTSLALAFDVDIEGLPMIVSVGADLFYYKGSTETQNLRYRTTSGAHIGLSPLIPIVDNIAIRADLDWGFGPGRTLFVGGGIQFSF